MQFSTDGVRTLDELKVIELEVSIREKPDWERKIFDESIVSRWRVRSCLISGPITMTYQYAHRPKHIVRTLHQACLIFSSLSYVGCPAK